MNNGPKTWMVILNWRNGQDTIDCLQSILECASKEIDGIVLCDNASNDDSIEILQRWASEKGIGIREYFWLNNQHQINKRSSFISSHRPQLDVVLIHTGANLGFAGGNNVGIRYIQQFCEFDFVFLLNNDALLTSGAVSAMVDRFESCPSFGMCGCTVVYHHTPTEVQALGGARFQRWLGRSQHIGAHSAVDAPRDQMTVENQLDYILGAALMISRPCLEEIGLMEEAYFLYYEEIDWATRAQRAGFRLAYSPKAVVFHKEGGTIGSNSTGGSRSFLSEYYLVRSRMAFTRKFYPFFLPTVIAFTLAQGAHALLTRDFKRFAVRLRAMVGAPI
jgi:GT2 family glycosyltransferase